MSSNNDVVSFYILNITVLNTFFSMAFARNGFLDVLQCRFGPPNNLTGRNQLRGLRWPFIFFLNEFFNVLSDDAVQKSIRIWHAIGHFSINKHTSLHIYGPKNLPYLCCRI